MEKKRIGVLTGGGDCPGLNPAIKGVVYRALDYGDEVIGLKYGWAGLLKADTMPLTLEVVEDILDKGGTILGSSRTNPFKKEEDVEKCIENFKKLGLDALIAIGGEDTLGVASKFSRRGLPMVGIPKTIDKDLEETEYTLGFDTAVEVVVDGITRLRDTAKSHARVIVVEIMGRHAGWLALYGGLAGGADYILIPEVEPNLQELYDHIKKLYARGHNWAVVAIAEGVQLPGFTYQKGQSGMVDAFGHVRLGGVGQVLAEEIEKNLGIETRAVILSHLQRGGSPSIRDRILGLRLGKAAVDLVHEGKSGYFISVRGEELVPVDITLIEGKTKNVKPEFYESMKTFFNK
ncbi:MAG: 6-phosphofructokinase [Dictyoglomus sp. NZ13-RE01]|nr:MAG: 6-phosphofructokinase [Dictyoglomus sp. NZ13-RE01]